jgi:hypothetical protein
MVKLFDGLAVTMFFIKKKRLNLLGDRQGQGIN